jgi:hypothetical protein
MNNDPATEAFMRLLKEDNEIKGPESRIWDGSRAAPAAKKTFKGNYGGGNEYRQIDPDLEYQNLQKDVLGSELDDLDERPGSVMVNDEEPGETTELEVDTGDGAAVRKGRPFAAPEGFTKITDGLPVSKDAPGKTKPGKELGEDVQAEGCSVCGHPRGHINFISCEEIQDFQGRKGYLPCLESFMAGAICSRPLDHEGGHGTPEYDGDEEESETYGDGCCECEGMGCDLCCDDDITPGDPQSDGRPTGYNGPQNGIAHEGRYRALPDDVIAEAIGDPVSGGPTGEGDMFPHMDGGSSMKEAPISPTPYVDGIGLQDGCCNCQGQCETTCDVCGDFVCSACEPEHNISSHSAGPYG